MAILLRDSGLSVEVTPRDPSGFTLLECYALIGCTMIQRVRMADGRSMVMDEEAKLKPGQIINRRATELSGLAPYDVILGNVLICSRKEFK